MGEGRGLEEDGGGRGGGKGTGETKGLVRVSERGGREGDWEAKGLVRVSEAGRRGAVGTCSPLPQVTRSSD